MSVNNKMTAIADEIRELSGATDMLDLNEMASHVDNANAKIVEQESMIADMNDALDNLGANATTGTSIATCTINVVITAEAEVYAYAYSYLGDDGKVASTYVHMGYDNYSGTTLQFTNVICNSLLHIAADGLGSLGVNWTDNIHRYQNAFMVGTSYFRSPSENGAVGTITCYSDD